LAIAASISPPPLLVIRPVIVIGHLHLE